MGVKVREKPPGSGIFWVFINHQSKRKSKKIGMDEKLANEVAEKIKAKLVLGELDIEKIEEPCPIFKDYCELWLEGYIKPTKRRTTYQRYSSLLKKYIGPQIGKMSIDKITRGHVRDTLLDIHKKGLSKSTVSAARNVISGTFEHAIDEELVKENPSRAILGKLGLDERKDREPVLPMTTDDVSQFLSTCKKNRKDWYPFFLCAFRTGMRLGELLALHWGDIHWNSKYVQVQRAFRNGRITKTKTSKSRRVDMSDQLYDELKDLYKRRKEEGLMAGKGAPEEIVFHTKGDYTSQNTIRNIWKRMLDKAKLRDMRFHDIRHSFASLLLSNGESPVYVKEQLGHSSIQMTVDIYGHLIPSSNRQAVNALDENAPKRTPSAPTKNEKAATH
ncbi:MAG: site-specific integrase [Desulfobacterales bacterium]|nr:site-specific integrase [Desulfobacterales bacterium]